MEELREQMEQGEVEKKRVEAICEVLISELRSLEGRHIRTGINYSELEKRVEDIDIQYLLEHTIEKAVRRSTYISPSQLPLRSSG